MNSTEGTPNTDGGRRPVVALDLDGVINPTVLCPGFTRHRVTVPAELLAPSPFVRRPANGDDLTIDVHVSETLGAWVNSIAERAEVVWASSWEHAANDVYAPLAGIRPLRVVEHHLYPPKLSDDVAAWKARALIAEFTGRPLCWVEDRAWGYNRTGWRYEDTPTLVLTPDERIGAVEAIRDAVEAFIDTHQPASN